MSSVSAIADDNAPSSSASSLPIITAITSGTKPAVDGVNGKLEMSGGASQFYSGANPISQSFQINNSPQSRWSGAGQAIGTITTPLGHSFGLQVDMGAGALRGDATGTAASHLFWRDPDKGQIGVYGQGNYWALGRGSSSWKAAQSLKASSVTLRSEDYLALRDMATTIPQITGKTTGATIPLTNHYLTVFSIWL